MSSLAKVMEEVAQDLDSCPHYSDQDDLLVY